LLLKLAHNARRSMGQAYYSFPSVDRQKQNKRMVQKNRRWAQYRCNGQSFV